MKENGRNNGYWSSENDHEFVIGSSGSNSEHVDYDLIGYFGIQTGVDV